MDTLINWAVECNLRIQNTDNFKFRAHLQNSEAGNLETKTCRFSGLRITSTTTLLSHTLEVRRET